MKKLYKSITLVGLLFVSSIYVGSTLIPEQIHAQEPPTVSPKEYPIFKFPQAVTAENTPVEDIDVLIDVENNNVTVTGAQNARVKVTTTNYPKEKVRYVTKYKVIDNGRPETKVMDDYIKSLTQTPKESFAGR